MKLFKSFSINKNLIFVFVLFTMATALRGSQHLTLIANTVQQLPWQEKIAMSWCL